MNLTIRNIVFTAPQPPEKLADFYAALLDMHVLRRDWLVVGRGLEVVPRLAFDGHDRYQPPRWEDPQHPQQVRLDLLARDVEVAAGSAVKLGARLLEEGPQHITFADPAGHAFRLYSTAQPVKPDAPGLQVGRIVLDCFSPRTLATFYRELTGMRKTVEEGERYVEIRNQDGAGPALAFQHSIGLAPRWPDPRYPQQIHLDFHGDDGMAASELALRVGAIRLPAMGGSCPVFADPAGHPFCLCSPNQ